MCFDGPQTCCIMRSSCHFRNAFSLVQSWRQHCSSVGLHFDDTLRCADSQPAEGLMRVHQRQVLTSSIQPASHQPSPNLSAVLTKQSEYCPMYKQKPASNTCPISFCFICIIILTHLIIILILFKYFNTGFVDHSVYMVNQLGKNLSMILQLSSKDGVKGVVRNANFSLV